MPGRCRGLALIGCAAAALATAASASARVVDATSILPPGDSGYVSLPGGASGGGSPHDYDKTPPFIAFDRKNAMLGQPGPSEFVPMAGEKHVTLVYCLPPFTDDHDHHPLRVASNATP